MFTTTADNLPRVMKCEGSRLMPASFPASAELDQTARNEGNAAHYMALAVFNNEFTIEEIVDRKAPNGIYMTAEMAEHVGQYLSAIDCGEMEVDTSFGCDAWRINGRADHIRWNEATATLTVDDLKYGHGLVEVERHWTLIWHAIGYCITRQIQPQRIELRIHQPRPYHPDGKLRTWPISYSDLMALYAELHAKLSNLTDTLNTGPHCRRCYAAATCPAYRAASMNAVDVSGIAMPDNMTNAEIEYELDTLTAADSTIKNRLDALKDLASHRIVEGGVFENYGREQSYGHSAWLAGFDGATLSVMTGKDLTKSGTVTPAEAKRRGVPEAVIKSLTTRPKLAMKLVRQTATQRANRLFNKEQ